MPIGTGRVAPKGKLHTCQHGSDVPCRSAVPAIFRNAPSALTRFRTKSALDASRSKTGAFSKHVLAC